MRWIVGLCDMQSFYASCEVATRTEYAARDEHDDTTDPPLVVAGDPERRSGIILAATPTAKRLGVENAMTLQEALKLAPNLTIVRPRMKLYMEISIQIQQLMRSLFPKQEQYSIDEGFFALPYPTTLYPDPISTSQELKERIWDQFRIRCRVGLADNKWMAKMANRAAKKNPQGIVWWQERDIPTQLHPLPVEAMWGLKRRAEVLRHEFHCVTIGDVAKVQASHLRKRFGVWGDVISRWANGGDVSPINSDSITSPQAQKGYSNRTTLPRDYYRREEICAVILELADEVCRRVRASNQQGRRIGLGLTYASFAGGFYKEKTIQEPTNQDQDVYSVLIHLLDRWWNRTPVRAIGVSLSDLKPFTGYQLSLFEDTTKQRALRETVDKIRDEFGTTSVMRGVSLTKGAQLLDRNKKIGGHYKE